MSSPGTSQTDQEGFVTMDSDSDMFPAAESTAGMRSPPPRAFDKTRDAICFPHRLKESLQQKAVADDLYSLNLNIGKAECTIKASNARCFGSDARTCVMGANKSSAGADNESYVEENTERSLDTAVPVEDSVAGGQEVTIDRDHCFGAFASNDVNVDAPSTLRRFVSHMDLRITDYFTQAQCYGSYVLYSLHFNDFGVERVVTRRYSSMCYYDCKLREAGYTPPVSLPEKRFWGNTEARFLSQRYQGLKIYFSQQLRYPSYVQLSLLYMYLGCDKESLLYLNLVTARTREKKLTALTLLFRYIMMSSAERVAFLKRVVPAYHTCFKHFSAAADDDAYMDDIPADYRLSHPSVVASLLECLASNDAKAVCEVCGILLWMLQREDIFRYSVLKVETIAHVTKAVSRLLVSNKMVDLDLPIDRFRNPLGIRLLASDQGAIATVWNIVSYFVVNSVNLLPEAAIKFLDNSSIEKLIDLVDRSDHGVTRCIALWLLWIGMCDDHVNHSVDRDALGLLLKKLYGSTETTLRVMCGLLLVSLISGGWFRDDEKPRATVYVLNLLPSSHGLDAFVCQQIFAHHSVKLFAALLGDLSLCSGTRLFLVSVLLQHLTFGFEPSQQTASLSQLCDVDYGENVFRLSHALFGEDDPDYRGDLRANKDMTFGEKFASLYSLKYGALTADISDTLYSIIGHPPADGMTHLVDSGDSDYSQRLCQSTAFCLLLLPFSCVPKEDGDYFAVDFDPQSARAYYRNVVTFAGGSVRLTLDSADHINLEDRVLLRLDDEFFRRRVSVLRIMLSTLDASVSELDGINASGNETTSECMELLRSLWHCRRVVEQKENPDIVVSFDARGSDQCDLFNNFYFDGASGPAFEGSDLFRTVDALELCSYASELVQYSSVQQLLLRSVKRVLLYHQACTSRVDVYRSMVACLQRRTDELGLDTLTDLSDLEEKFLEVYQAYSLGVQEERDLAASIEEKNGAFLRIHSMLRSAQLKVDVCRRQMRSTQARIDDIPRLRDDGLANQGRLALRSEQLMESIRAVNSSILELQGEVARVEREKLELGGCIQQLTELSSVLDKGIYSDIIYVIDSVNHESVRSKLRGSLEAVVPEHVADGFLDADTVHRLKAEVLQRLTEVQERLSALCESDASIQIAKLNSQVSAYEDSLYRTNADLQSARKSMVTDGSSLEESLATQKRLLGSLESTVGYLSGELSNIQVIKSKLDKDLAKVKSCNEVARSALERRKATFLSGIKEQRKARMRLFQDLLGAEFLCKKLCQERCKLARALSHKPHLLEPLRERRGSEHFKRQRLIETLKLAAKRLEETANFLECPDTAAGKSF
ncbi:hypothetical protein, conserved [Babesia bigemina]|uniref:PX domain-containing protein n=1 Tax=Babesia bigemina TaxID=5866 RepID=A0A061DBW2_BABBI|nr:hypothetical protein, conserved [Babesia bigemina]CDR96374.1 hypothetical protein, conserved [Babesia bigemina]|eukprot:XP_012768560.1 hypothetical protein, conserved [Babesia bigemina]